MEKDCNICNHKSCSAIDDALHMGMEWEQIVKKYLVSIDDIAKHIRHGSDEEVEADEASAMPQLDLYLILKKQMSILNKRRQDLYLEKPGTVKSRELISLARAINETAKTIVMVRKELGVSDDTRLQEYEKIFGEIFTILPKICSNDRQLLEKVMGLTEVIG